MKTVAKVMADATRNPNDDFSPMAGSKLWVAGIVLAFANFIVLLDTTIANVSVPNIAGGLAVSPSQGTWVITSYAVAEAITVPLTGWLAQRFGAVRVFSVAMLGFGACSALCGLASSLGFLVFCRILQGLAGGPMIPLSQTLLRRIFPSHLQPTALGLWAMTTVVAPIAGPLLGGVIVDNAGWPWVFYINVPFAVVVSVLAWRMLMRHETRIEKRPIDRVGLVLLVLWISAMQIMLDKGKDLDWFDSPIIVGLALVAAIGFISFIIWELTDANPVVNLRVFRNGAFSAATLVGSVAYGTFFSSVVLIPLWLQTNMGYTATWAGRAMALTGLFAVILSPVVARLTTRVDLRAMVSFGVGILAAISFWRSGFTTGAGFWDVALPVLAQGVAMPFFFIPITALSLSAVKPSDVASAAGLMTFTRTSSAAFSVSIMTTAWENTATVHHTDLAGTLNHPGATIDRMRALGMTAGQGLQQVDRLVQGQAVMLATDHIFLISAVLLACASGAMWLVPKPAQRPPPDAGGH